MAVKKVQILDLGSLDCDTNALVALKVRANKNDPAPRLEFVPFPVWAVYIETEDRKILFDTGILDEYDENVSEGSKIDLPYNHVPEQDIENQLALCGVKPEDIDYVVISHMHWDHAGNIGKFKNAKVVVQRDELEYSLMFTHTVNPNGVYLQHDTDVKADWMLIDGDLELTDGVNILRVPGHAQGLQCLQLTMESGKTMLFTSDACYTSLNWGPPVRPAGVLYDSKTYFQSVARLKAVAAETDAFVVFGHDIEQFNTLKKAPEYYE